MASRNGLTCCNETEALDHGMLGHMSVPFHDVHDVAVFVSDGRSPPVVPQPHAQPLKRLILTLPSKDALERTKKTVLLFIKPIYANLQEYPCFARNVEHSRSLLRQETSPAPITSGYNGPANLKTKIGGKGADLSKATSSTKVESRDFEIIKDSDNMQGILTTGDYMCPKCDCVEVYAYLEQTRLSDEPETRMLTCKECGNGWREY